jgi:hypothetical protein
MSASERWKKKKAGVEEDPQEKKNKVRTVHIILALLAVLWIRIRIRIQWDSWIRIRNPNLYPGGQK